MSAPQLHTRFTERLAPALHVGFLCPHNPFDLSAFSGAPHHAARALDAAQGVRLRIIGGHRPRAWHDRVTRRFRPPVAFAPQASEFDDLDIVVGLVATSHLLEAQAATGVPLVHVTDATPSFLREFYGRDVPREADLAEAKALSAARLVVYSSDYMAERALAEFGGHLRGKIVALPFGANCTLPQSPRAKPPPAPLRLLWIGSSWERKGGPIALAAFDILRAEGLDVELTLVGDVPVQMARRPGLHIAGWLDKNRAAEAAQLQDLYAAAHLFLLPTRADCTPMVTAEAGAHGTPVLVTNVGGMGSLVAEGVNGRMLPLAAGPVDWAQAIREMTDDRSALATMSETSFAHVRSRLTWDAWAAALVARLQAEVAAGQMAEAAA
jgi:glycosyltransferase involved in cell wall biosynthesis